MRWLLTWSCALALVGLSAALNLQITQNPRFYGVRSNRDIVIHCSSKRMAAGVTFRWYRAAEYDVDPRDRVEVHGTKFEVSRFVNDTQSSFLHVVSVQESDSGVYFCKRGDTWGPGTHVVAGEIRDLAQARHRIKMKDTLIVLQGLLLAATVGAALLRRNISSEEKDIIYEEPETDHIYEGLAVERCDGGLYEELSVYAQAEDGEAPWE